MNNIKERFKQESLKGKILMIFLFIILVIFLIAFTIYQVGSVMRNLPGSDKSLSPFDYALNTKFGRPISLIVVLLVLFVIVVIFLSANKKNYVKSDDERGVHYMKQATHGSAEWMDKDRAKEVFTVCNVKDTSEIIYGQFSSNGEEVVGYKKPKGAELNRNVCIIAPPGGGKSFTQARTHIFQHIKAGNSIATTDPDGSAYKWFAYDFKNRVENLWQMNFSRPAYSMCWNIVKECIDDETERLNGTRLNLFVDTFVSNTGDGVKDHYFDIACNLIKAIIGYTSYWNEKQILEGYGRLYRKVSNMKGKTNDEFFKRVENEMISFKWCRQEIMKVALKNGYKQQDIEDIFLEIRKHADTVSPFTIEEVYENVLHINKFLEFMDAGENPIEKWHPAYANYTFFKSAKKEHQSAAVQGAQLRFELFIDPDVRHMLSNDGIDLRRFNTEQTALFIITQDKSTEMNPIASLLFTFLFKNVQDVFDYHNMYDDVNQCLGSAIILDDFFSLGLIGGKSDLFATTMSNARKREVYITIIIQNYKQIGAVYGHDYVDSIQGNCSTTVFLGTNDPNTAEFIEKMMGVSTVLNETHNERARILSTGPLTPEFRSSTTSRPLVTKGEALAWKDSILVKFQGENPLKLNPFTWEELPEFKAGNFVKTNIYKEIKPYYEAKPLSQMTLGQQEENSQAELDMKIISLANFEVDELTGEVIEDLSNMFEDASQSEQEKTDETIALNEDVNSISDDALSQVQERADKIKTEDKKFTRNEDETDISFAQMKGE